MGTGKSNIFRTGDFVIEMIHEWHTGVNIDAETVRLLIIDQIETGKPVTILRNAQELKGY